MAGNAPVSGRRGRGTLVLLGIILLIAGAAAAAFFWLNQHAQASSSAPTSVTSSTATGTPTATGTSPAVSPSSAELSDLQSALSSSDAAKVLPYLPLGPGQTADAGFPAQLAALNLTVDGQSLAEAVPGVWSVQARDGGGHAWDVGLVRKDGHLVIFSAEKAVAP